MLRVSVHSSLPSQASRYNRTDWVDIGYQELRAQAEYKIVLIESGKGAREPIYLQSYPRWSSSLWDLAARAIALSYWSAPPARETPRVAAFTATDADGEPVQVDEISRPLPGPSPIHRDAGSIEVPMADEAGSRGAFATMTTALITHYPSTGSGGRRLGTMLIAHDKRCRGMYRASVVEDPLARRIIQPFLFSPAYLSPVELVLRSCLHILAGNLNVMPECPILKLPKTDIVAGVHYLPIHRIEEPARTGFIRWLHATKQSPKPEPKASMGRVPARLFATFMSTAV